ncbi:MAG: hypothetical protein A2W90_04080 [Bacteroidetes bacterium GWF2_42_66]|nr:MAG: hypothetical protein A2W92_07875 [Bacteroidetes bacterium GWA2_42_15]OFY02635.1 MAG: hypothetical protein A2W89_21775 [Bacteroidetes bacterium GWE2_42_39]OFY41473.1 MAG: hypothetical protein A2W90_04080 [Bacteroidetes bacterium GWF2_42_66]
MNELKEIKATFKSGKEFLTDNGLNIQYQLLDFWRWSVSDILSNATRGRFAEFIVGTAIDFNPEDIRDEWNAYDLLMDGKIKIEVKSAAYIQCWNQKQYSPISFSIKSAKYWDPVTNIEDESKRHADLYVFCHLKHKDQNTIDPLKMEQWDFYVLPTFRLDNYKRSQSSITLKSLQNMTNAKEYCALKEEILQAYNEQIEISMVTGLNVFNRR